ncbi:uncharacterized protein LOC119829503 [Zerene cesonia]|uniref:uncharacterized protein LOC119829503 n=1 Tax=Zerene cesonia TaxID=33412 RepID=UPI0018E5A855|nr:uncharacterized protein LOC119829503 [Zerene cesonia]
MWFRFAMFTILFLIFAVNCAQQTDDHDDTSIKAHVNKYPQKQKNEEYFPRLRRNAREDFLVVSNKGSNYGNRGYPNRDSGSTVIILPEHNYDTKYTETTYRHG